MSPRTPPRAGARLRDRAAAGRLDAAKAHFERSMIDLRRAAFDHVDRQVFLSTALRASLERLSDRLSGR